MAQIGYGYGSECDLLRWMGRHRNAFDKAILKSLNINDNGAYISWLDFNFDASKKKWQDSELLRLDFISDRIVKANWKWPINGKQQNWDAVGYVKQANSKSENEKTVILLEAKANLGEIISKCGAGKKSRQDIDDIFKITASGIGVHEYEKFKSKWFDKYYQLANRLATYYYLKSNGYQPHLILLYFIGDNKYDLKCPFNRDDKLKFPSNVEEWSDVLSRQDAELGITNIYKSENVYKLFLHVSDDHYAWTSPDNNSRIKLKDMMMISLSK